MQIKRYEQKMADEAAALVVECFAKHQALRPMSFLTPPAPWETHDELLAMLESGAISPELSHVAIEGGRIVSAAVATHAGEHWEWWRIATLPSHRRRGHGRACMEAGESAAAAVGLQAVQTGPVVDSRWQAAQALLSSLGYELEDPERRNITMVAESWTPRQLALSDGYELQTLRTEDLPEWMEVRNAVFGGDAGTEWFEQRFLNRPDFDPGTWFTLRHDGRIIGIASALCIEHERDPEMLRGGQIEWVGVLDSHRGKHLGEELVVACLNAIAERGFLPALLLTQPFRVPAVTLYEKLGFRTVSAWHRWTKRLA
jgi:mycothiol synthase